MKTIFKSSAFALSVSFLAISLGALGLHWYRRDGAFTPPALLITALGALLFLLALGRLLLLARRAPHPVVGACALLLGGAAVPLAFVLLYQGWLLPPYHAPVRLASSASNGEIMASMIVVGALLVLSFVGTPLHRLYRSHLIRRTGYDTGQTLDSFLSAALLLSLVGGVLWHSLWYAAWFLFLALIALRGRGLSAGQALLISLLQPLGLLDDLLNGHTFMVSQLAPAIKSLYATSMVTTPLGIDSKTGGTQLKKDDLSAKSVEDQFLREQLKRQHDDSKGK